MTIGFKCLTGQLEMVLGRCCDDDSFDICKKGFVSGGYCAFCFTGNKSGPGRVGVEERNQMFIRICC